MPLNSGMLEVLHDLHGLLRTWHVPLHRRPMWNASFLYSGRRRAMLRCLEMGVCIKLRQCWKKRPAHGISSFRDLMLMIGTYRLKVGTFSQIRTDTVTRDWQLVDSELKLKKNDFFELKYHCRKDKDTEKSQNQKLLGSRRLLMVMMIVSIECCHLANKNNVSFITISDAD